MKSEGALVCQTATGHILMFTEPRSLYVSQQGCSLSLRQEQVLIKQHDVLLDEVQLPMLEQILIFGQSQVTTQLIRACLQRDIPIVYLSRMGHCYGRLIPISRGYRALCRYQQELTMVDRLQAAQAIVQAKLQNSRVILLRQQRRQFTASAADALQRLEQLINQITSIATLEQLMGLEGAGAACYFPALGSCLTDPAFVFTTRSRRPPTDPANAILSFGYQMLWNHLLSLIELRGLDPYWACLHEGSDRHAALASDLLEEFRAPIVDSLLLYLVNASIMNAAEDFDYPPGACYLNESGRKKYLRAFLQRMEEPVQVEGESYPRWHLLNRQIKAYKQFVYNPSQGYQPYRIR
jgi:CRISPR-associated protein Cas1